MAQKVMIIQSSLCDYARVFSLLFFRRIMHENLIMLILRGKGMKLLDIRQLANDFLGDWLRVGHSE